MKEIRRLKRSVDKIPYLTLKVPKLSVYVEGDSIYIKKRVQALIEQIRTNSSHEVFTEFREQFIAGIKSKKEIKEEEPEIGYWAWNRTPTV